MSEELELTAFHRGERHDICLATRPTESVMLHRTIA